MSGAEDAGALPASLSAAPSVAPSASISAMYQDALLAHHRAPRNRREIASPGGRVVRRNPVCGDEIAVMVVLSGDVITDVSFGGRGCSIATASASMMTEAVHARPVGEALALADAVDRMLHAADAHPGAHALRDAALALPDGLTPLRGVAPFAGRHGCALLPWQALREALRDAQREALRDALREALPDAQRPPVAVKP